MLLLVQTVYGLFWIFLLIMTPSTNKNKFSFFLLSYIHKYFFLTLLDSYDLIINEEATFLH